jgi:hypothetical protein
MSNILKSNAIKKTKNLSKALSKVDSSLKSNYRADDINLFTLPPIEKEVFQKENSKPTSILTRYLEKHTQNFLKTTKEEMSKPIIIKQDMKHRKRKKKGENEEENFEEDELDNENDEIDEKNDIKCMTERGTRTKSNFNKFKKNAFYLTEIGKMKNISPPQKTNKSKKFSSSKNNEVVKKDASDNYDDLFFYHKKNNLPSSIRAGQRIPMEKRKKLDKYYYRLKTYQPKIYTNWKTKTGLTITVGNLCSASPMISDVDYQSSSFRDQSKLLEDNISYYKMNITSKPNYVESFCSLSLMSKIEYNKALEETIGILLLLPQLILLDFYKFIQKFENINVPAKEKFEDNYIFDEVENLLYNNNLLSEVIEFFQNCFEVYLLLINEVDDMSLKPKNFSNIMTAFEKARYNICYCTISSENALNNYNKDLRSINKFNKNLGIVNTTLEKNAYDKMMNQFYFKKNAERQRKLRIEACLNYKKDEEENELIFTGKSDKSKKIPKFKFNSIIDSDLVTKLLKNCRDDAKNRITTERINNEIDGEHGEEGQMLKNSKRQVIKLNF